MTVSAEKVRSWWSVPRCRATARAWPLSSKLGSSKPIENVRTFRGRLELAERRGDARRVDPAREEDAERHVRPPVPRHRRRGTRPRTARRPRSNGSAFGRGAGPASSSTARSADRPASQTRTWPRGQLLHPLPDRMRGRDVFIEEVAGQARRDRAAGRPRDGASSALGSEPKTSPPPGVSA